VIFCPLYSNLNLKEGSTQEVQVPQVPGHAADTPAIPQRVVVSLLPTHEHDLEIGLVAPVLITLILNGVSLQTILGISVGVAVGPAVIVAVGAGVM